MPWFCCCKFGPDCVFMSHSQHIQSSVEGTLISGPTGLIQGFSPLHAEPSAWIGRSEMSPVICILPTSPAAFDVLWLTQLHVWAAFWESVPHRLHLPVGQTPWILNCADIILTNWAQALESDYHPGAGVCFSYLLHKHSSPLIRRNNF